MLLAIDTSTDTASLALVRDSQVLAELTWYCGQNHTVELLPQLTHFLHQIESGLQAISGIIVARGPGSFNGLRVGISTAKGLAFSLGIPVSESALWKQPPTSMLKWICLSARYLMLAGGRLPLLYIRRSTTSGLN